MSMVVGETVARLRRQVTPEDMRAYCEGLDTAAANDGRRHAAGLNIHTDAAVAQARGLPRPVADGMVVTNWVSAMLTEAFGDDYLMTGRLRTRFAAPVFEHDTIEIRVDVVAVDLLASGERCIALSVLAVNDDGSPCVTGEASVRAGRGGGAW